MDLQEIGGGDRQGINIDPDRNYDKVSVVNPDSVAPLVEGEILIDVGGGRDNTW
jgi:hypothetical protein